MPKIHLALVRHGQSLWNEQGRFTGWTDIDLSRKGGEEARQAGRLLKKKGVDFDFAFCSVLKRSIRTLWIILDEMDLMWIPVTKSRLLNERHYGALQGQKKEKVIERYGKEQVQEWRRGFSEKPPKGRPGRLNPKIYGDLKTAPEGESLKDTLNRLTPLWEQSALPLIRRNKSILISAHGNSLRALTKRLETISDSAISSLNIPTGQPVLYTLNSTGRILSKETLK